MPRYASIWFPYLLTEYAARKNPELRDVPFVLASPERGRMVIQSVNGPAIAKGIHPGMVLADCKAIFPELEMRKSEPGRGEKILNNLAEWCIGYTPFAAVDSPDGLILDTSGCTHLWGGEMQYLNSIQSKLEAYGYTVRAAIADTIGAASAMARFGNSRIVDRGAQKSALLNLPSAALRLEELVLARLKKLGLDKIGSFIDMPKSVLRRRFGASLPHRIGQALGHEPEIAIPVKPVEPYQERLCCMEPIVSSVGITIALERLLEMLCTRLKNEGMGLRNAVLKAFRVDGNVQQIEVGTGHPSCNPVHIFRLFSHKIQTLEPALGFELFLLEAPKTEAVINSQESFWNTSVHNDLQVAELLDRVAVKTGPKSVMRYLPAEHYWPERSVKPAMPLWEKSLASWRKDFPRPVNLLANPEPVEVSALLPDYPPMLFRHKGNVYTIIKSDGPERIEQEWWLSGGLYRDYYCVEDENGARYWLFRSGPYHKENPEWFIHGYFA